MSITPGQGVRLRIPAGGLTLPLDGSAPPSVTLEMAFDVWPLWFDIALDHLDVARESHEALLAAISGGDSNAVRHLEPECRASMVAMSACAFAVDAFYSSVQELAPIERALLTKWDENRLARYKRIAEVLRLAFRIGNESMGIVRDVLRQVFAFRDCAVHPPGNFRQPVLHPELATGVEWRFVAFRHDNAREALRSSLSIIAQLLPKVREENAPLADWAASDFTSRRVDDLLGRWPDHYPPILPPPGDDAST